MNGSMSNSSPNEKVISKKELDEMFKCKICGHDEYELSLYNGAYVCLGCSVLFKDPKKFTEKHVGCGTRDQKLGDKI